MTHTSRSIGAPMPAALLSRFQRELNHQLPIQAHHVTEGGLRGHSVGDTWPYRVVGKGDGSWEVHRNGCAQRLTRLSIHEAHQKATALAEKRRERTADGLYSLAFTRLELRYLAALFPAVVQGGTVAYECLDKLTATLAENDHDTL